MAQPPSLLLVSGDAKTGTSSLVGMLNTHPEVFVMYEADPNRAGGFSKRAAELLERYPEARGIFQPTEPWTAVYHRLAEFFAVRGHHYRFFGDKVLQGALTEAQAASLRETPVIHMVRDLRTWLCKNVVVDYLLEEQGVAGRAVQYVDNFLRSFLLPRVLHVSMEELIHENEALLARLDRFLELPLSTHAKKWWQQVGRYAPDDPKGAVQWWVGHDSSQLQPRAEDTKAKLREHPFWDRILPIFDRYYQALEAPHRAEQVAQDRQALAAMLPCTVRHEDLYESVKSVSFGKGLFGAMGHRSSNPATKPFKLR